MKVLIISIVVLLIGAQVVDHVGKLLKLIYELLDYPAAFLFAMVGWILGLGMACVSVKMGSGVYVKMHGWACQCSEIND